MADISITPSSFVPTVNAEYINGLSNAAVTIGQTAYLAADGRYGLAEADSATVEAQTCIGLFATTCSAANQPVRILTYDPQLVIGGTVVRGKIYCLSGTAGGISVVDGTNPTTGWHGQFLAHGYSTSELYFKPSILSSPAV